MNAPLKRCLVWFLWLASLLLAFQWGQRYPEELGKARSGETEGGSLAVTMPSGASPAGEAEKKGENAEGTSPPSRSPEELRELLGQVLQGVGQSGAAMYSPSALFRSFGPLMELSPEEAQLALKEVANTVTDPRPRAMFESLLLGRWAEKDPQAALAYAETRLQEESGSPLGGQLLFSVISSWAQHDPESVWSWYLRQRDSADNLLDDGRLDMSLTMIFSGMSARDLSGSLARLEQLTDDTARSAALRGMAFSVDAESRQSLLNHSARLPEDKRNELRQIVVEQWVMTESRPAMDWLKKLPPEERQPLLQRMGHALVYANPESGAELLLDGADDDSLADRYTTVVQSWATREPIAAGEWLNRQPSHPAQDEARGAFAQRVVRREPETAMAWAQSIREPPRREFYLHQVYKEWKKRDAGAADAALEASGLDPERIVAIRAQSGK